MLTINSYEEFAAYEGKELGVSEWVQITQERIDQFANATDDQNNLLFFSISGIRLVLRAPRFCPIKTAAVPDAAPVTANTKPSIVTAAVLPDIATSSRTFIPVCTKMLAAL